MKKISQNPHNKNNTISCKDYINNIELFLHSESKQTPKPQIKKSNKSQYANSFNVENIFELLCNISQNFLSKHNSNIYNSILTSRDIPNVNLTTQLNQINSDIYSSRISYSKLKVKDSTTQQKKVNDNSKNIQSTIILDNQTEINDTLSINSLDLFYYNNYFSSKNYEYDEKSLQEFLLEETKNIKRSQILKDSSVKEEINQSHNITTNSIKTPKKKQMVYKRPMTPNLLSSSNKSNMHFNILSIGNENKLEGNIYDIYININLLKNKKDKKRTLSSYNKKIYEKKKKINYKPKIMNKENNLFNSVISYQKNSNLIKIFNSNLESNNNFKGKDKKIFSQNKRTGNYRQKTSSMSKPKTSNTSRNICSVTSPKKEIKEEKKRNLFNIKIDLRELMKEENEEREKGITEIIKSK